MRDIPARLWKRIEAFIERAPIPSADRIRLRQFTVFVLLGVPTMVAYGLYDLARGEYVLSSIIFASALGLSAGLYALGRMERNLIVYRINLVLYCVLLVHMLVGGGEGGSKILWMYTFPFIAFFLIGKREGILWAGGMLLLGAALLMGAVPGLTVYPYPKDFRIRFLTVYAIVAAIAFWFEHFRETYRTGMETKCLELEDEKAKFQESEEGLKKAQQFANVGSWTWHIQSNRLEWSEQMFRIFGIDKDGFTGDLDEVIARAIHPDDRASVERSNMSVVRDKKPMPLEYRILEPDGTVRTVWAEAGELLLDDAGEPAVLRGIVQDITERKRAEQTQALMAAMLDATPGFVGFADAKDTHILYINQAGRKMVGIQAQEDVTRFKIADVHPEWTNKLLHDEIIPMAIRDGMWIGENAFLNRDGREIPVLMVLLSHKSPKGEVERFSTVSIDITDRKRAEEEKEKLQSQLQQAMKMEAIGRLAGGVAHDFNNMLTVITGYSDLLLQKIGKESPMHREVGEIKRAGERAAALTQQLLAFSRKQIIDPKVVRPDLLVAEMQAMLTRLIGENIALQAVTGKGLGSVMIAPGQFQQILMNLAVNSRDAMPGAGEIVIETANVDLDENYCATHPYVKPGRFVMLAVSDTGVGMSDEVKEHIFEPFFTTKKKGSGTGLGLATTYGTVKQSGGSIEVYSEVGIGTTVKIYLPRVEEEAVKPVEDDRPTDLPGGTETVLVVEDEVIVRTLCVQILERLGYKVLQARNGTEAIVLAQGYGDRIDLLLTDVVMPGMNGWELATQLVLHYPEMKVLFMSGYTDDAIVHHGVLVEGVSFIGKPYTPSALGRKVREVLDKVG